ncbi:40S ribosomal protein S18 [Mycena rebaudengoi]|nr:40S ribosomal protein S18 [Mycena rebaudengoi]
MSLVVPETRFQHILRLLNTNVDGEWNALTEIKGVNRRYSNLVCKKAYVDLNKRRAGDLNSDELERTVTIIQNPTQFKIPTWFLNRQGTLSTARTRRFFGSEQGEARDETKRKKLTSVNARRETRGLRVRGQHTKTTGKLPPCCVLSPLTTYMF